MKNLSKILISCFVMLLIATISANAQKMESERSVKSEKTTPVNIAKIVSNGKEFKIVFDEKELQNAYALYSSFVRENKGATLLTKEKYRATIEERATNRLKRLFPCGLLETDANNLIIPTPWGPIEIKIEITIKA